MRFLHTADWHLGRLFHQIHLTNDQAHVIDQIVNFADSEQVDVVIVAGDLYDRAVPPPEAVELLNRTWEKLVYDLGIPVVAIPGNHDSATRVGFGSKLMAKSGLHLISDFDSSIIPVTINGIDIYGLPYAEPAEVRAWSGNLEIKEHADAMNECIAQMRKNFHPTRPRMLVGHAFVSGGSESESERPLSIGGSGQVPVDSFQAFHYTALGHLHAPQKLSETCYYSGSPMKYSFSEASHSKSIIIGEINNEGVVTTKKLKLSPKRDVRDIKGDLAEIIQKAKSDPQKDDYIRAILTDEGALLNAIGQLREVYPNVMQIERSFLEAGGNSAESFSPNRKQGTETELFESFWNELTNKEPQEAERKHFNSALSSIHQAKMEKEVLEG